MTTVVYQFSIVIILDIVPSDGARERAVEVSAKFAEGLREGGFGYSGCFL